MDQDSAKEFYADKLGFTVTSDTQLEGGMRWLTVRPPGNDGQEPLLMGPLHSMLDEESAQQVRALVAKGALSPGVMATSDCKAAADLESNQHSARPAVHVETARLGLGDPLLGGDPVHGLELDLDPARELEGQSGRGAVKVFPWRIPSRGTRWPGMNCAPRTRTGWSSCCGCPREMAG